MLTLDALVEANGWWKTGAVKKQFVPGVRRGLYHELLKEAGTRQMTAVIGLRRTGKSTLFYQLIQQLLDNGVLPANILYFSFDEHVEDLNALLAIYQENVLKKDLDDGKTYLFFDEIQKLGSWQDKLKILYDLHPRVKTFVSGSASIDILKGGKETLAGRIFYHHLKPLSFKEFLELKGVGKEKTGEPLLWKKELRTELGNYLTRAFPEIVLETDEKAKRYVKEGIIDQAIFRDLRQLFRIKEIELIEKLAVILASNPGAIINLDDLSKDLGRSRQVLSNYLYYLETCFIAKSFRNYRGSKRVSSRKLKKYYLAHPSLSLALSASHQGKVIENLVASETTAGYYWREGNKEVDFVASTDDAIEVKYANEISAKDLAGLIAFMHAFKAEKARVITDDKEGTQTIEGKKITFIPLWKWLLQTPPASHAPRGF